MKERDKLKELLEVAAEPKESQKVRLCIGHKKEQVMLSVWEGGAELSLQLCWIGKSCIAPKAAVPISLYAVSKKQAIKALYLTSYCFQKTSDLHQLKYEKEKTMSEKCPEGQKVLIRSKEWKPCCFCL